MADPRFPVGGMNFVGRRGLPRRLRFENFVCQNERIWALRGRAPGTPPRSANGDTPFIYSCNDSLQERIHGSQLATWFLRLQHWTTCFPKLKLIDEIWQICVICLIFLPIIAKLKNDKMFGCQMVTHLSGILLSLCGKKLKFTAHPSLK